jgi:hypothetical protein
MSYSKMIELHGPEAEGLLQKDSQTLTNNHLLVAFTEIVNRIKVDSTSNKNCKIKSIYSAADSR